MLPRILLSSKRLTLDKAGTLCLTVAFNLLLEWGNRNFAVLFIVSVAQGFSLQMIEIVLPPDLSLLLLTSIPIVLINLGLGVCNSDVSLVILGVVRKVL